MAVQSLQKLAHRIPDEQKPPAKLWLASGLGHSLPPSSFLWSIFLGPAREEIQLFDLILTAELDAPLVTHRNRQRVKKKQKTDMRVKRTRGGGASSLPHCHSISLPGTTAHHGAETLQATPVLFYPKSNFGVLEVLYRRREQRLKNSNQHSGFVSHKVFIVNPSHWVSVSTEKQQHLISRHVWADSFEKSTEKSLLALQMCIQEIQQECDSVLHIFPGLNEKESNNSSTCRTVFFLMSFSIDFISEEVRAHGLRPFKRDGWILFQPRPISISVGSTVATVT